MRVKQWLAIGLIITLLGIIVYNVVTEEEETYDNQGEMIFVHPEGQDIEQGGTDVGDTAPNFQLKNIEGETVQLADFRGKKVFMNFWASWCDPCKDEMPDMQKLYEEYSDEVVILAVNTSESNKKNAVNFVNEYGLTFPVLFDETSEVAAKYNMMGLPMTYFINSEGEIQIPPKTGPMEYDEMVEKMNELD
ncbi:TlpA disulfide reductase family protein [Aquisalibacillus elongatus]|uniref:Peroxiredoxin n=1 Tax=Aquisalibacillus elongatus TaxID=485577 RepID=A0A3N5C1D4_9BACI|nr:TlpA disulfide reductase family protein [Aquisalibacillus elongatus]RPF55888.1 peroxiredoxin [Aquisalibacillus elongatus]